MAHVQADSHYAEDRDPFGGKVEADESYFGGKAENMHKNIRARKIQGRGAVGKTIVAGILQREDAVVTEVISETDADTLIPFIEARGPVGWGDRREPQHHACTRGVGVRNLTTAYVCLRRPPTSKSPSRPFAQPRIHVAFHVAMKDRMRSIRHPIDVVVPDRVGVAVVGMLTRGLGREL